MLAASDGAQLARPRGSYADLVQAVRDRARHLAQRHSVGPGDRVAIFAVNAPEYIEAMHACWWLGAVAVPVNFKLHPAEAAWIFANSGAKLVLTDAGDRFADRPEIVEDVLAARVELGAEASDLHPGAGDDLAWLFYTSGTTESPRA